MHVSPVALVLAIAVVGGAAFFVTRGDGPAPVAFATPDSTMLQPKDLGPIPSAATVQGILPAGGTHLWTFDAAAGQVITVRLSTVASSSVAILPPGDMFSLVQVATDPGPGTAEICAQPLAVTGTYTLQVQSNPGGPGEASGPYLIRIEQLGSPGDAPPAAVAETLNMEGGMMMVVRSPPCQAD